jgi:hypothetical protein
MTDTPIDVPRLELDSIIGFNGKNSFPTQKYQNNNATYIRDIQIRSQVVYCPAGARYLILAKTNLISP